MTNYILITLSILFCLGVLSCEERQTNIKEPNHITKILKSGVTYLNDITNDIRDRMYTAMEKDLAGCSGETKSLADMEISKLLNPNDICRETCGEQGYIDDNFKYMGTLVNCCCTK